MMEESGPSKNDLRNHIGLLKENKGLLKKQ
jgi:hypothetical protein